MPPHSDQNTAEIWIAINYGVWSNLPRRKRFKNNLQLVGSAHAILTAACHMTVTRNGWLGGKLAYATGPTTVTQEQTRTTDSNQTHGVCVCVCVCFTLKVAFTTVQSWQKLILSRGGIDWLKLSQSRVNVVAIGRTVQAPSTGLGYPSSFHSNGSPAKSC